MTPQTLLINRFYLQKEQSMWAVFMSFIKQEIILPFRKKEFTYSELRSLKAKTDLGNGDQALIIDHGRLLYTSPQTPHRSHLTSSNAA